MWRLIGRLGRMPYQERADALNRYRMQSRETGQTL